MRSSVKTLMACLFILSVALFVAGCGSSSSDGGSCAAPTTNGALNGTWCVSEVVSTSSPACITDNGQQPLYSISISEDASGNLTVSTAAGTFSGRVCGNSVSWTGSYPDSGGTTTLTSMNATYFSSNNTITGSSNWTWSGFGESCVGTTSFSATSGPCF